MVHLPDRVSIHDTGSTHPGLVEHGHERRTASVALPETSEVLGELVGPIGCGRCSTGCLEVPDGVAVRTLVSPHEHLIREAQVDRHRIAGHGRFTSLGQSKPLRRLDLAISGNGHCPCFVCLAVG